MAYVPVSPRLSIADFDSQDIGAVWLELISLLNGGGIAKGKLFPLPVNGVAFSLTEECLKDLGVLPADMKFVFGGLFSSAKMKSDIIDGVALLKMIQCQFKITNNDPNTATIDGFYIFISNGERVTMAYVQEEQGIDILTTLDHTFKMRSLLPINNGETTSQSVLEIPFVDVDGNDITSHYHVFVKVSGVGVNPANVVLSNLNEPFAWALGRKL